MANRIAKTRAIVTRMLQTESTESEITFVTPRRSSSAREGTLGSRENESPKLQNSAKRASFLFSDFTFGPSESRLRIFLNLERLNLLSHKLFGFLRIFV